MQKCDMCKDTARPQNVYFVLGELVLCEKHFNRLVKFIAQNKISIISMLK